MPSYIKEQEKKREKEKKIIKIKKESKNFNLAGE